MLREIPSTEDGDFSYKKLEDRYNGDLANGLGNLVQRVATLIDNNLSGEIIFKQSFLHDRVKNYIEDLFINYDKNINDFKLHEAFGNVWALIGFANTYVDSEKPWVQVKESLPSSAGFKNFLVTMTNLVFIIHNITWLLQPFMPDTADKIFETFGDKNREEIDENYKFLAKKGKVLFPRLQ